jgi:hypothetical protein
MVSPDNRIVSKQEDHFVRIIGIAEKVFLLLDRLSDEPANERHKISRIRRISDRNISEYLWFSFQRSPEIVLRS